MPFSDIYGHEKQVMILRQFLAAGRIPHALLLHGIPGTGKLKVAITLAQALNCLDETIHDDACGQCIACRKIERGNHPDLFFVKPEGQFIRIAKIREIQEKMLFKPMEARVQMFIMTDADRMNSEAANALLKTLEEPLSKNIIILTTARLYQLPLTIVSRCQQLRFNPLPKDRVTAYLVKVRGLAVDLAEEIALLSGGSIGKAEKMQSQSEKSKQEELLALFLKKPSAARLGSFTERFGQEKEEIVDNLLFWKSLLRDVLVYKTSHADDLLINAFGREAISCYAGRTEEKTILKQIDLLDKTIWAIEHNANKQLTLDTLLIKIMG